jgi:nucleoside-triphosphatase
MGLKANIVITGLPGCGKTSLFKKLVDELRPMRPVGFYTEEIRERGVRKGFALTSLDGRQGVLAHVGFSKGQRVGKYGVDVAGFEAFLGSLRCDRSETDLVMIDEIGKMECLSQQFQRLVKQVLDSERMLIATIAQHGAGLIAEIKSRSDVRIYSLTTQNRDALAEIILAETKNPSIKP